MGEQDGRSGLTAEQEVGSREDKVGGVGKERGWVGTEARGLLE